MHRLSLVVVSGDYSSLQCSHFSLWRLLLLWSTGFRRSDSVAVAFGLSWPVACGIFLDQGLNPHPLHCQVDSFFFLNFIFKLYNMVLVLPNIKMNPPQVYPRSPS